jgi:hypothetical protein
VHQNYYLSKADKDFMDQELADDRKDPSKMLKTLASEYVQRAQMLYFQAELAGRYYEANRVNHEQFWVGIGGNDEEPEGEEEFIAQLGRDNKELVAAMWKEGDKHLVDQKKKEGSCSRLTNQMEFALDKYAGKYVSWAEHEVSKKDKEDHDLKSAADIWTGNEEQTGKEAGHGTVGYVTRCMQTMVKEEDPSQEELDTAHEVMGKRLNWRQANWKKRQFSPMKSSYMMILSEGNSPQKTPTKSSTNQTSVHKTPRTKEGSTTSSMNSTPRSPSLKKKRQATPNTKDKDEDGKTKQQRQK